MTTHGKRSRATQRLLLCILACAFSASSSLAASLPVHFSNEFDSEIQSSVRAYWPDYPDWLYLKAQLYQESRLDPNALSPAGAAGIAQFMGPTWNDMIKQLGWSGISANQAGPAIQAAGYYMGKLRRSWTAPRPKLEQHFLGIASYNSGIGNIASAQKLCGGKLLWAQISPCLPVVTGALAQQTVTYVARIVEWRKELDK